jgi:hypothetical protein
MKREWLTRAIFAAIFLVPFALAVDAWLIKPYRVIIVEFDVQDDGLITRAKKGDRGDI